MNPEIAEQGGIAAFFDGDDRSRSYALRFVPMLQPIDRPVVYVSSNGEGPKEMARKLALFLEANPEVDSYLRWERFAR